MITAIVAAGSVLGWAWATSLQVVVWAPRADLPDAIRRLAGFRPQGGPAEVSRPSALMIVALVAVGPVAIAGVLARGHPSSTERLVLEIALAMIVAWTVGLVWILIRGLVRSG